MSYNLKTKTKSFTAKSKFPYIRADLNIYQCIYFGNFLEIRSRTLINPGFVDVDKKSFVRTWMCSELRVWKGGGDRKLIGEVFTFHFILVKGGEGLQSDLRTSSWSINSRFIQDSLLFLVYFWGIQFEIKNKYLTITLNLSY